MDAMVEYLILVSIVVLGVGLVLLAGIPVVDRAKANLELRDSEEFLFKLDSSIKDVSREGQGSSRLVKSSSGNFRVSSEEDVIEYSQRTSVFDYLTRKINNGILLISGTDANCYEADADSDGKIDLVMENSYITVAVRKVNGTYNTKDNIIFIKNKSAKITPIDSSIMVDSNAATAQGNGISYLQQTGQELSKCRARFLMNSTLNYDVFYTLYSGADFLAVDVRNIR